MSRPFLDSNIILYLLSADAVKADTPAKFTIQNTFASPEGDGFELRLKLVMIDPPVD